MALSATLAELETWIRQDADMQAPDDRLTSEECRNRINRSLAQLYDRLVLVDQEYFLRSATVTSNGSGKYDIMNDLQTGVVRSIQSVIAPGSGYANGATVTLSQGGNATATGIVQSTGGAITGITLTSSGHGYFDAPLSSSSWTLTNSALASSVVILFTPTIVGTNVYFNSATTGPIAYVYKYDTVANTLTDIAIGPSGPINEISGYDSGAGIIYIASSAGELHAFDTNTDTAITYPPLVSTIEDTGVVYGQALGELYYAHINTFGANYLYRVTGTNTLSAAHLLTTLGVKLLGYRLSGGNDQIIIYDLSTAGMIEVDGATGVETPLGPIAVYGGTLGGVGGIYATASNRFYIVYDVSGGTQPGFHVGYWDYATSAFVDITVQLTAAGWTGGFCVPTYDVATDTVWLGQFDPSNTSGDVFGVNSTTPASITLVPTSATTTPNAFAFGSSVIVSNVEVVSLTPSSVLVYNYSATPVSLPNYIALNVSGGTGGQVLAYIETDFYKCKGVWFANSESTPDNGDWTPLRRFNWEQQNALNQSNLYDGYKALPLYRIITENNRDKLLISPDNISGAYKLWYYPSPMKLLLPTDRFDGRAGWDEWIVKDVAIQLLMAEESVEQAAALKVVRDEIWQRLQLHAEDREAASPQKIMDVTVMSRRYGPRWAR